MMNTTTQGDFILGPGEKHVQCPYNVSHIVTNAKIILHLTKCRREYEKECERTGKRKEMRVCNYNSNHRVLAPEIEWHQERCDDRFHVVETIRYHASDEFTRKMEAEQRRRVERDNERREKDKKHKHHDKDKEKRRDKERERGRDRSDRRRDGDHSSRHRDRERVERVERDPKARVIDGANGSRKDDRGGVDRVERVERDPKARDIHSGPRSEDRGGVERDPKARDIHSGPRLEDRGGVVRDPKTRNIHSGPRSENWGGVERIERDPKPRDIDVGCRPVDNDKVFFKDYGHGIKVEDGQHGYKVEDEQHVYKKAKFADDRFAMPRKSFEDDSIWGEAAEDWEAEAKGYEAAYNPEERLQAEVIMYQPRGLSKSERKLFRSEQKLKASRPDSSDGDLLDAKPFVNLNFEANGNFGTVKEEIEVKYQSFIYNANNLPPPKTEPVETSFDKEDGECSDEDYEAFIGEDPFS